VRCYYVPDHYIPVCLKHPLVTMSLDSLRPLIMTSLLKSLIWSLRPLYVMSPVWNVPECLRFVYVTSLDQIFDLVTTSLVRYVPCLECPWVFTLCVRYVPWSLRPLITTSLDHNVPWTQHPCGHYIPDLFGQLYIYFQFFSELHQPMDWLGI
jgi:hypothetical protein